MNHYVMNAQGQQIAVYQHASELKTFLEASFPQVDLRGFPYDVEGVHEIKGPDGKLLARVNNAKRE
jgi:hypothetical protein